MNRIACIALVTGFLVFCLAGCSSGEGSSNTEGMQQVIKQQGGTSPPLNNPPIDPEAAKAEVEKSMGGRANKAAGR